VSFVVKPDIENNEKLVHADYERGLGMLTAGTQPQIQSSDGGIAANPSHQDAPDLSASTPDTTAAAQFSTIAVEWRQPSQCPRSVCD
jgi:hypothetical protein